MMIPKKRNNEPAVTPELVAEHGLSPEEYARLKEILGREPSFTELGIFSVMWSEHCSYKNSKPVLKKFPTTGPAILQGPGENAGIVDIGDGYACCFKIESHNHPSAVEPYQGAATGVGGILRDIFTMGARPVALLNSLRFGDLDRERVRYLLDGVVHGIADYGNCVGVPTVGGEVRFSSSYNGNPLVNAMCVGIMKHEEITLACASGEGNLVVYFGSTTGRDGIHGATFASEELGEDSESKRPSVQVGDPFMGKMILEATLELIQKKLLVGIQDMGAAGLTCSNCEMASRGGAGVDVDVSKVPQRAEGMTPYEILLSESQERMLAACEPAYLDRVREVLRKWEMDAHVIGTVTTDGLMTVREQGEVVARVPARKIADDSPIYQREGMEPEYLKEAWSFDLAGVETPADLNAVLKKLLASPNICSKRWVYEQYDHMIQDNTLILPGADAAVIRVRETGKAIALCTDGNGRYCYLDPYEGGKLAVAEAARNVSCVGAKPLAITNCLNFGTPTKPRQFYQLERAVSGMAEACEAFSTPVTGGNVSLYNETEGQPIYPTPVVGMVGLIEDPAKAVGSALRADGNVLLLLGENTDEIGGSEYLEVIHGKVAGRPPRLDLEREKAVQSAARELINARLAVAAHDLSDGGLAVALAEMCLAGGRGAVIDLKNETSLRPDRLLFGEGQSRIVVEVPSGKRDEVLARVRSMNVPASEIGRVVGDRLVVGEWIDLSVLEMNAIYEEALPRYVAH